MLLTVRTPEGSLFQGEVTQITLETLEGQITILPQHMPLTTVLKAGLIECIPVDQSLAHNNTFVFDQKTLTMAIGSGIAYIDGTQVEILASASLEHNQDITSLEAQASKLQSTITKLESDDKPRELESAIEELDRVKASIKFVSKAN